MKNDSSSGKWDGDSLYLVELSLCGHCLNGYGDECHSPGCALFLNRPPDLGVDPDLVMVKKKWAYAPEAETK